MSNTPRPVASCETIHGTTFALLSDGTYAHRFGSNAPWSAVDADTLPSSVVDHLADGGDVLVQCRSHEGWTDVDVYSLSEGIEWCKECEVVPNDQGFARVLTPDRETVLWYRGEACRTPVEN